MNSLTTVRPVQTVAVPVVAAGGGRTGDAAIRDASGSDVVSEIGDGTSIEAGRPRVGPTERTEGRRTAMSHERLTGIVTLVAGAGLLLLVLFGGHG